MLGMMPLRRCMYIGCVPHTFTHIHTHTHKVYKLNLQLSYLLPSNATASLTPTSCQTKKRCRWACSIHRTEKWFDPLATWHNITWRLAGACMQECKHMNPWQLSWNRYAAVPTGVCSMLMFVCVRIYTIYVTSYGPLRQVVKSSSRARLKLYLCQFCF